MLKYLVVAQAHLEQQRRHLDGADDTVRLDQTALPTLSDALVIVKVARLGLAAVAFERLEILVREGENLVDEAWLGDFRQHCRPPLRA